MGSATSCSGRTSSEISLTTARPGAQAVVALRLVKRLDQLALLNAHQIARFLLDVPELHVRKNFERGAVTILESTGAARHAANAAGSSPQKADEAVGLAQRERL